MKDVDTVLLICRQREARRKARSAAAMEILCLLRDLHPTADNSGPLAEQGGVFWIALPSGVLDLAVSRLPCLGYTHAVDILDDTVTMRKSANAEQVHWHHRDYRLVRVYEEDPELERAMAPDRRTFWLESAGGEVRPVKGYRGEGGPLSRRGLPTCDARLLVNLVTPLGGAGGAKFLDPFAGVGGLVLEAVAHGFHVLSGDNDLALRYGLKVLGANHCVANAGDLPFDDETIGALATEPPYDKQAQRVVLRALAEMERVLKPGGRLAMLCAAWQANDLRREGDWLGLRLFLDSPIHRKGTECTVVAWEKADSWLSVPSSLTSTAC